MKFLEFDIAYKEMAKEIKTIFDVEGITHWLKKYKELYDSAGSSFVINKSNDFKWLYEALDEALGFLNFKDESIRALAEYEFYLEDNQDEEVLLYWLVTYENLGSELLAMYPLYFGHVEGTNLLKMHNYNIYFPLSNFSELIEFQDIHNSHYLEMLKKYRTTPEDEWQNFYKDSEACHNHFSLKYHLHQR